jgi:hypothetical protein
MPLAVATASPPHWPHAKWLFAAEFFVFAPTGDGKTKNENPTGMQHMFRFREVEEQHQYYSSHADEQAEEDSIQSFFKSIRIFKLFSYFRAQFIFKHGLCFPIKAEMNYPAASGRGILIKRYLKRRGKPRGIKPTGGFKLPILYPSGSRSTSLNPKAFNFS